jgi:hypothetical protein
MAWTETTRPNYQREGLRYASDTTDAEWATIERHLPPPAPCGRTDARNRAARCRRCHLLDCSVGLPVAYVARGFPAVFDGPALFLRVARQRSLASIRVSLLGRQATGRSGP